MHTIHIHSAYSIHTLYTQSKHTWYTHTLHTSHELHMHEAGGNGARLSSVLPTATAFLQEGLILIMGEAVLKEFRALPEAEAEPLKTPLSGALLTNRMTIITRMPEHHLPTLQNKLSSCFYDEECSFHFYILQITKHCLHKTKLQYYQK